jgi:hypothetical protein
MSEKLRQIFKNLKETDLPERLEGLILAKIRRAEGKSIRRKLFLSYIGLTGSAVGAFYAIFTFGREILNSEFGNIISLAFSDLVIVAEHWREFALSLLETLPVINMAAILAPVFILLLSMNAYLNINKEHKYI